MDHLGAIALFNRVAEAGSFAEAARLANLSTSTVSRRVSELEAWVGATLIHRTTRKLSLTEAGRAFHARSRDILLDLEEARTLAGQVQDEPSGLVRISMPASLERHVVVAAALFQGRWPKVEFNLVSSDRKVDLVAEGFDLALRAGRLRDSTMRVRKIAEVRRRLCASPAYLASAPPLARPADIERHACLILSRTESERLWRFRDGDAVAEVRASAGFVANSGNMLAEAARCGRGLLLSPDWMLGPLIASGELVELLPGHPPDPERSALYAVHPYQRFIPPQVRFFIDFLTARFGAEYDWTLPPERIGTNRLK